MSVMKKEIIINIIKESRVVHLMRELKNYSKKELNELTASCDKQNSHNNDIEVICFKIVD